MIRSGGAPTVRDNTVCDGRASGVYVYDGGAGVFEGNVIERNAVHGVAVRDAGPEGDAAPAAGGACAAGRPRLVGNVIRKSGQNGVFVYARGGASLERCEVSGSGRCGIVVAEDAAADVAACKILNNRHEGLWLSDGARVTLSGWPRGPAP